MRRMGKRIVEINLGETDAAYEGQLVTAWVNFPSDYLTRRRPGDEDLTDEQQIRKALGVVIQSVDFVDYDGQPYPPMDDPDFWAQMPNDMFAAILQAIYGQVGNLTKKGGPR